MDYLRSWQTGEGRTAYSLIAVCVVFLVYLLKGDPAPYVDELLKHATNFKEIAEAYSQEGKDFADLAKSGEIMAILVFMYKTFAKITDSRTDLKKKKLENEDK